MARQEEIYRSVKLTDSISPMSLSVTDQLRLMVKKASNDSEMELESQNKVTTAELALRAGLTSFFETRIEEMHRRKCKSFMAKVSSRFLPVLDDVIDDKTGLGRFYSFEVRKADIPITINHMFIVTVRVKEAGDVKVR